MIYKWITHKLPCIASRKDFSFLIYILLLFFSYEKNSKRICYIYTILHKPILIRNGVEEEHDDSSNDEENKRLEYAMEPFGNANYKILPLF